MPTRVQGAGRSTGLAVWLGIYAKKEIARLSGLLSVDKCVASILFFSFVMSEVFLLTSFQNKYTFYILRSQTSLSLTKYIYICKY